MYTNIVARISKRRLNLLKQVMETKGLCGIVLFEDDPIGCKLAVTEHFNAVIVANGTVYVLADASLYHVAVEESPWDALLVEDLSVEGLTSRMLEILQDCKPGRGVVGVNRLWGRTRLRFLHVDVLEVLHGRGFRVVDATEALSRVFDKPLEEELQIIEWLSSAASNALRAVEEALRPGMREYELAAVADRVLDESGVTGRWFQTIVASGPRAAAPHAKTSSRRINPGDPVVVDLGPLWMGYDGCVAYTFVAGGGGYWRTVLEDVLDAIRAGLKHAKPGTPARILDETPRSLLRGRGYPDYPHLTGHPIGGFYKPVIAGFIDYSLEQGMVFAYEPAVYLPGKGGVRVEPHILVDSAGYTILTWYHRKAIG